MNNSTVHFFTVFTAFFTIMDPIDNSSLFLSLADGVDSSTRRLIALRSVVATFIIFAVFAIAGQAIFPSFEIRLPALRIAG